MQQKPDVQPSIDPPRRVPLSMLGRLKKTLDVLDTDRIIAKVDKPTDWVNSLVIVEKKDGSLRLCLDPTKLNQSLKREHFMIPTLEDVTSRMGPNKKKFTVADQINSYWQVPLDEKSSYLCTFNTPFGRYRFLRMPFGISTASEVLQKRAYENFGDIENVYIIADDMLIAGADDAEHDKAFVAVMERAKERNVKFNKKKLQFKQSEVKFSGNIIGEDGLKPDDLRVKAIVDMPAPTDVGGVHRLIGVLNYLAQYIPNMSEVTSPIRALLKKDADFQWLPEHQAAFDEIKQILSSDPVLSFFDQNKDTVVQADASSTGLGACLIQDDHPIAYASRSLSESEQRWSQIEKELLAIVFATERFHHYIYGRDVQVLNDHKPLETIMKKPIHSATPRIQVMLLKLMRYPNLKVKWIPGSKLHIADTLSRAHVDVLPPGEETIREIGDRIHSIVVNLPISDNRREAIQNATKSDESLQMLRQTIENGWPRYKKKVHPSIRSYWTMRNELYVAEDLIFKGEKLVIPTSLRSEMLDKVHEGHLGMDKCKSRARSILYWPGMTSDIETLIAKCSVCATYRKRNQKEPLLPHPVPTRPWSKLGSDIFDFGGKDYLVIVDYYSKFPEVCKLESKTAKSVIAHLKTNFARYGIPDTLIADNMPYGSNELKQFAKEWGFEVITTSPRHAQANGQSENMVGQIKQMMRKADKDPHLALLQYRNTPVAGLKYSPSQLLNSRVMKDKLPCAESHLMPKVVHAYDDLVVRQRKQKRYFDRGTKPLSKLQPGDSVRVHLGKTWEPAVVSEKHSTPRSYWVTTENGQVYRRNRKYLQQTSEPVPQILPPEDPDETISPPVSDPHSVNQQMAPPDYQTPTQPQNNQSSPIRSSNRNNIQSTPKTPVKPAETVTEIPQTPVRPKRRTQKPTWMSDYVTQ